MKDELTLEKSSHRFVSKFCGTFFRIYLSTCFLAYLISEVQCGQRVALIGMVVKQCGHSLVVGTAGVGSGFFWCGFYPAASLYRQGRGMSTNLASQVVV